MPLSKSLLAVIGRSLGLDPARAHSIPDPAARWEDSLRSDDIQLHHDFLDPGGKPGFGLGGVDKQAQIFPHCPLALKGNLSSNFPLCIKHICARNGHMYSVWEDDPRQL